MKKKKSYNPLKLWGAWLMLILGIIFDIFLIYWAYTCGGGMCGLLTLGIAIIPIWFLTLFKIQVFNVIGGWFVFILMAIIQLIILFFFGYFVHAIIRRIRK